MKNLWRRFVKFMNSNWHDFHPDKAISDKYLPSPPSGVTVEEFEIGIRRIHEALGRGHVKKTSNKCA